MAAPVDAQQLLVEVQHGLVSDRFYDVYCERAGQAGEAFQGVAAAFVGRVWRGLTSLIGWSTAPLSRSELRRTIEKMTPDERTQFAALVLELDTSRAGGDPAFTQSAT